MKTVTRTSLLRAALLVPVIAILLASSATGAAATATSPTTATTAARGAAPAAGQTEIDSWALAPTGSDPSTPSSRISFSYSLEPGATIQDSATLLNFSNVELTFRVYATDAFNTSTGAFTLLSGAQKPKDVGSWIQVSHGSVTLPPNTSAAIPFTVTVPADAKPGDHVGGMLASSQTVGTGKGHEVNLDRRIGSPVYLRVNGPVNPAMTVENLSTTYHGAVNPLDGSLDVRYRVRNTGNIRLSAHQSLTVGDVFGKVEGEKPKDIPELLPGSAITLTRHVSGLAATVRLNTAITLTPFAGTGTTIVTPPDKLQAARSTTTAHTWAIPWTLLAVLLILALLIAYLRRRRRRRLVHTGPGGSDGGGGLALPSPAPTPRAPVPVRSVWLRLRGVTATR